MRAGRSGTRRGWLPSDYIRQGWTQAEAAGDSVLLARDAKGAEITSFMIPLMASRAFEWTAIGAIQAWLVETADMQDYVNLNNGFIDRLRGLCGVIPGIDTWNNAEGRTRDEVITALEAVEDDMGLRALSGRDVA